MRKYSITAMALILLASTVQAESKLDLGSRMRSIVCVLSRMACRMRPRLLTDAAAHRLQPVG